MELIEIKMLRVFFELNVIKELYAIRSKEKKGWRLHIKLKDGREFGVRTAIKTEKIYAKLDTLVEQIEEMNTSQLMTIKVI